METIEVVEKTKYLRGLMEYPRPCLVKCDAPNKDNESTEKAKAVIICTGGGYYVYGEQEGFPIARIFSENGYVPFILCYSLGEENPFPTALKELAQSVSHIRNHNEQYDIDPDDIIVCGVSAGGHLTASLGVHWNAPWTKEWDFPEDCQPNRLILCYPVTGKSSGEAPRTFEIISRNLDDPDMEELIYPDQYLSSDFPPTFITHNVDDTVVPVESTIEFMKKLKYNNVHFEGHLFPIGDHYPFGNDQWLDLALKWLEKYNR